MPLAQISAFIIVATFALEAGCAGTPEGEDPPQSKASDVCPAWKIVVVEDERIFCVDPDILEREREIIEDEDHW
jgi:hypothetical protein